MATTKTPTYIFIVEDKKRYVNMLDYIFLKDLSYRFVNFKTGEECLTSMSLNPQMVVLDHTLPGMNGYETLMKIKKDYPHTYVLILISDKDDKLPSDLFEAGADDYILNETNTGEDITDKIESFLTRDKLKKSIVQGAVAPKYQMKRVAYLILILLLAMAGLFYYN